VPIATSFLIALIIYGSVLYTFNDDCISNRIKYAINARKIFYEKGLVDNDLTLLDVNGG